MKVKIKKSDYFPFVSRWISVMKGEEYEIKDESLLKCMKERCIIEIPKIEQPKVEGKKSRKPKGSKSKRVKENG